METEYVITNPKFETNLTRFKNRINELMLINDPSIFEVLEMYEASSFIKKTIDKFLKDNKGRYLSVFHKNISLFQNNLTDDNLKRFFTMIYDQKQQFSSFLVFFEENDLSKKMSENSFQDIVFDNKIPIQCFLKSEFWIDKYPNAIKDYFLSKDINIKILLQNFMNRGSSLYIPKNITKDEFYQLATSYVENLVEFDNKIIEPDYNFLIFMSKKIQGLEKYLIVDKNLYKKIIDQVDHLTKKFMSDERTKIFKTKVKIHTDLDDFKKSKNVKGFVDTDFLRKYGDFETILNEIKYLTGFFNNNGILNLLCFNNIEKGLFDFLLSIESKRYYEENEVFGLKQVVILSELDMFGKVLMEEHNILFEDVIEYFFHKYSNDNFNLKWFKLDMTRDSSLKVRTKINFTIEEFIRKQWKFLLDDGYIDPKLFNFSNTPSFRELGSYLSNKYIYSNSDELDQLLIYLFTDQHVMGVYNELIEEDNFVNLVSKHEVKYSGFLEYQQKIIDILLKNNLVSINKDILYFNEDQLIELGIYKHIWMYGVINYYNYPQILLIEDDKRKYQDKINELLDLKILRSESTLFSIPEMNYLNYLLNNSQYDNSIGLRNKYEHDFITEDESEYQKDYLYSIMVLLFYIVKINEEFHFKFLLDNEDGLMTEVYSLEDILPF
ncbi:hypothetical protein [Enterococcus faecium]|uniref:hypothetical protein n=1 Tax=Enterococcus faecium TaxID=1352 RepID=UPI00138A06F1|nr:hypothetical protein [Enterococcus faecium]NDK21524.1 hypothetical protein [Enterococcus faecium]NDK47009.1 hypothetical protein [Enterococcus faecium]